MTPPRQIGNPILGRAHENATDPTPAPEDNSRRAQQLSEGMEQTALANQIQLQRGISREYADSLSDRIEENPAELINQLVQYRNGIHQAQSTGDLRQRPFFYFALRNLFLLMPIGTEEQLNSRMLEFMEIGEAYQRFLSESSLTVDQQFRYLYAVTQIAHSALARLQAMRHDPERSEAAGRWIPGIQNLLGQMDRQCLTYFEEMETAQSPYVPYLGGLVGELRLRQALLSGNQLEARTQARNLIRYYQESPLPLESEDGFINSIRNWEIRYRDLATRPNQLANFTQLTPELRRHFYENAIRFEFFAQIGSSLDQYNETDAEEIQRRYQALSAVFSALSLATPGLRFSQILEQIRNPDFSGHIQNVLQRQRAQSSTLAESITDALHALGTDDLADLVHLAQQTAQDWQNYRRHAGERLMGILFEEDLSLEDWVPEAMEAYRGLAQNPEDHELGALANVAQLIVNTESLPEEAGISARVRQQARNLLDQMNSFSFRAERIASHLFTGSGLITLIGGTLFAELAPSFLIGRAGRAGRYANLGRRLGYLVEGGALTRVGAIANGVGTGLVLSFLGSAFHNWERAQLGFETHFWRDFATSSAINTVAFGAAMGTSHILSGRLAPNLAQGHRLGRIPWGRAALIRGGSIVAGGSTALIMGTLPRGLQSGHWLPTLDEVAESYLTMVAFELFGGAYRSLRQRASLRTELGNYYYGSEGSPLRVTEQGLSMALTNRYLPVLGAERANALLNFTDSLMMEGTPPLMVARDDAYPHEQRFLLERLGLEEMHHPGVIQRIVQACDQGASLYAWVEGEGRDLFFSTSENNAPLWNYSVPQLARRAPDRSGAAEPGTADTSADDAPTGPHRAIPPPPLELPTPQPPTPEEIASGGNTPLVPSRSGNRHVESMPAVRPGDQTGPLQIPSLEIPPSQPLEETGPGTVGSDPAPAPRNRMSTPAPGQIMYPGHSPRIVDELFIETGRPRAAMDYMILENLGEVAALTEVGNQGGPSGRRINEDAFAIYYDAQGRVTLIIADGMGGHAGGELASQLAVQTTVETLSSDPRANLLDAFQAAHSRILQETDAGGAAASAVRIHPSGRVEMAGIGDTQVYVGRLQPDDTFEVLRVSMPDNIQGRIRDSVLNQGGFDTVGTLQMHQVNGILSALGRIGHSELSPVSRISETPRTTGRQPTEGRAPSLRDYNLVVHREELTLPSERNSVYRLQPGDLLLLLTDGGYGQFTTQELANFLQGDNAAAILQGIRGETHYRQHLMFRAAGLPNPHGLIHLGSLDQIGFDSGGRILFGTQETGMHLELNNIGDYFSNSQIVIQPFRALEGRYLDSNGKIWEFSPPPPGESEPVTLELGRLQGPELVNQLFQRNRLRVEIGSLEGYFIDYEGNIFDRAEGGNLVAHVGQDNMGMIVYRHLPGIQ